MITAQEIEQIIMRGLPDAKVSIFDMTGTGDHFDIRVASKMFAGKSLIAQHKMVFALLEKEMDQRIHAVQIKTQIID